MNRGNFSTISLLADSAIKSSVTNLQYDAMQYHIPECIEAILDFWPHNIAEGGNHGNGAVFLLRSEHNIDFDCWLHCNTVVDKWPYNFYWDIDLFISVIRSSELFEKWQSLPSK
jgi:hypothetical protein